MIHFLKIFFIAIKNMSSIAIWVVIALFILTVFGIITWFAIDSGALITSSGLE